MKSLLTTYLSLFLGITVLLCGAHAKDVSLSLQPLPAFAKKVLIGDDGGTLVKTSQDLHNHVDKQTLNSFSHDPMQADSRSLHRKQHAKQYSYGHTHRWLDNLWLQYLSVTV
ncbi:MAG TPA: hypothetical protein VH144_03870 [Candidatus Saccharimonadales bacterium]|jgi:hypothetical protein|nr:hypothetical protein [Candidatus Saccharimonadales bacterium]